MAEVLVEELLELERAPALAGVGRIQRRLGPLALRFRGMKPPRFATVFEGVINAMACQQLTLTLGIRLINRHAVAFGTTFGEGNEAVHAFPRPVDLAHAAHRLLGHQLPRPQGAPVDRVPQRRLLRVSPLVG